MRVYYRYVDKNDPSFQCYEDKDHSSEHLLYSMPSPDMSPLKTADSEDISYAKIFLGVDNNLHVMNRQHLGYLTASQAFPTHIAHDLLMDDMDT